MNILFTCAGRRNYLINFFKDELNGEGLVIAADMQMTAPAMASADRKIIVPHVYASNYIDSLLDICKSHEVRAVVSLNDLELPILADNIAKFDAIGSKIIVAPSEAIDIAFDKKRTIEFATALGIETPLTFTCIDDAIQAIQSGRLHFPLVVKPRWGSASIGLEFPTNLVELELAFRLLSLRLGRTMLAEASQADFENAILIQEKIEGIEFGVDVLNDFNGCTRQVYVKEKLAMRAGETDKSVLRYHPDIENLGHKIGNELKHIGNLDCDFFEKEGRYYLLEMNPRFGGGYPFTHMSGGNYVAAILSFLRGEEFDFSNFQKRYNVVFSKCDNLIQVSG
jgi:carbamoyl-phosphate synthase large subunit